MAAEAPTVSTPSDQAPVTRLGILRNRPLMTLMLGHYTVDMYSGIIPFLYPLLTDKFHLNLGTVGFVSLAYSGASSLSQPFFGMVADRKGIRFIGLALMWTGFMFSILGFAPNFPVLLLLAALAGLGSGAYHPMGALGANAVIDPAQRNVAMSVYVTGGTLGVACGPLIGATLFHFFGLRGTAAMILPGFTISIWMLLEMRQIAGRVFVRRQALDTRLPPIPLRPMAVIIGLMMMRSWTMSSLQAYIPTWYQEMGYSAGFYSLLTTTLLLSSVVGAIGSGSLADKHGRKILMLISSVATVPVVFLFAEFPGWFGFVSAAMVGLLAASTGPLLIVMAQQLMHGRAGVASGLILGLGFVMGAIGVPIIGAVGDHIGLQGAFRVQAVIASGAIILALMLPNETRMADYAAQPERATS